MCNFCEPKGWKKKVCNFCGTTKPHTVYISIAIATDRDDEEFPYTQTDLCKPCFETIGIDSFIDHNNECRKDSE